MSAKETTTPKSTRVTKVQVPGESAPVVASSEEAKAEVGTDTTAAAEADQGASAITPLNGISPEAHAELQAENEELRAQIAASGRAPAAGRELKPVQNRADYLTMRAVDVDPETLTKAVLTKDGWVCPPAIAKAQPK